MCAFDYTDMLIARLPAPTVAQQPTKVPAHMQRLLLGMLNMGMREFILILTLSKLVHILRI